MQIAESYLVTICQMHTGKLVGYYKFDSSVKPAFYLTIDLGFRRTDIEK